MPVPDWVQDSVFYQIFPDRFANGDPGNDPPNVETWGTPPTARGFKGGDLRGIRERLEYLADLGVTALYLNPIFEATSNHRYDTIDYYRIDSKLGNQDEFRALLNEAHRAGMRVLLDGVFNHCGRGFRPFVDLLENEGHSPFKDWFHVRRFPLEAYTPGKAENYVGWWDLKSLPKFNTTYPPVRAFLLSVARYWIEQGIDGWRLDVPNEIDDDAFWAEFQGVVKDTNPDAYLLGEIWELDPRWVKPGHFDGLMNYPLRKAMLGYVAGERGAASEFVEHVELQTQLYPAENLTAHYVPLGTHDTERLITLCRGEPAPARLALLLQFTLPGAPAIYYGDEVGLPGGKDPACRAAFPWDPSAWMQETREHVKRLVQLRRASPALRRGGFRRLLVEDKKRACAFLRSAPGEDVVVAVNASSHAHDLDVPLPDTCHLEEGTYRDALSRREARLQDGRLHLHLPARSGALYPCRSQT